MSNDGDSDFNALLDFLKQNRGFDFTGYKTASLVRRIQKRMHSVEVKTYIDYIDYLEVHPEEFTFLFNTILINVTGFFRDPQAWEYLRSTIIPHLTSDKGHEWPIRVWSAGCSSGEEAYSVGMLLAEALGEGAFSEGVKIYATDIDEEALTKARMAVYSEKEVEGIPADLLNKYFTRVGSQYGFHKDKDLRRSVIFGRNNLIQDAPISRVDLLICRNTLMYFNAETQGKILSRLHFALRDNGYLFLGKAEMLLTHTNLFNPIDLKLRIFSKVPKVNLRDRLLMLANGGNEERVNHLFSLAKVREEIFETAPLAQVVIDLNNQVVLANSQARSTFGLSTKDVGRPIQDLLISYRPVELRSYIQQAYDGRIPVLIRDVEWVDSSGDSHTFDFRVQPLMDNGNALLGVNIIFIDTTLHRQLEKALEQANHELETAYAELQSSNEELETTNEELQSTIEELETTNEELQSTNEELETMNEELQSINEELHTTNEELQERTTALNRLNAYMDSVLASVRSGMVVLDRDLRIQIWNRKSEDLWGLREDEVKGQNFLNLDIGLPVEQLKRPFRACLAGDSDHSQIVLDAHNRRGREIRCKVTCTPLLGAGNEVLGVITMMEEQDGTD